MWSVIKNGTLCCMVEESPQFNTPEKPDDRVDALRRHGFSIEKMHWPGGAPLQCEKCVDGGDFGFYDDVWAMDGEFYCDKHKEYMLEVFEKIAEETEKRKMQREQDEAERRKGRQYNIGDKQNKNTTK